MARAQLMTSDPLILATPTQAKFSRPSSISSATGTKETVNKGLLSGIAGAAIGFVTGGPAGAIAGGLAGGFGGAQGVQQAATGQYGYYGPYAAGYGYGPQAGFSGPTSSCPPGYIRMGQRCVSPGDFWPGGAPAVIPTQPGPGYGPPSPGTAVVPYGSGMATVGAFGMPAAVPQMMQRVVRRCGKGMVLGEDDLCYPKAVLGRRSKFRKWRAAPRPLISNADVKAIRRAASVKNRVAELGRDVGLHVAKSAPRRAPKK